jgi:ATP-dependent Lon protease
VKNGMEIIPVKHVSEVLKHALTRQPVPIEWTEPVTAPAPLIEDEPVPAIAH